MPPDVVNDARRRVLSPQPVMTCISTLVRLFQLATSDAATWMFCAVLSAPVSPVEGEGAVRAEVRAARADRFDAVDVELPERRGDAARRVDAVAGARQSSTR